MADHQADIRAVTAALKAGQRWVLASHENPDGDAIGSLVGLGLLLESLGRRVTLLNPSGVPEMYRFLPGSERIVTEINGPLDYDGIVILDSGHYSRIGALAQRLDEFPVVINLDHHVMTEPWGTVAWVDDQKAAVGMMVHTLAQTLPARITPDVAMNLYTAIMTDTGSFRYGNTGPRVLAVASELAELGAEPAKCAGQIYLSYTPQRLGLLAAVLSGMELKLDGRLALTVIEKTVFDQTGAGPADLDGFTDYFRGLPGVEVAAILRRQGDGYKFSLRSAGRVNVAELAARIGGGGHRMAAGAFLKGDRNGAEAALIDHLGAMLDA